MGEPAALILTVLALARIYLGMEWLSGALMGITMGLAWTAVVGFAYRQRATRHFSGGVASMIFYGSLFMLFVWQVNEHTENDLAALQSTMVVHEISADDWWEGAWADMLIYSKNPLDDIMVVAKPRDTLKVVIKDGKVWKNEL